MVKKTSKNAAKVTAKKTAKKVSSSWFTAPRAPSTMNDVKTAVLLVSLTLNLAVFVGWLLLRLTTIYDAQVYNFLFNR